MPDLTDEQRTYIVKEISKLVARFVDASVRTSATADLTGYAERISESIAAYAELKDTNPRRAASLLRTAKARAASLDVIAGIREARSKEKVIVDAIDLLARVAAVMLLTALVE